MNLSDAFFRTAEEYPERMALWVGGHGYDYDGLVRSTGGWTDLLAPGEPLPIISDVSPVPYSAALGAVGDSHAYVPIRDERTGGLVRGARAPHLAYILFTSGSTGEPKGVPITHENSLAYVNNTIRRLDVTSDDRFSQMHSLAFDFSVHDVWVPWNAGASVYVVPKEQRFAPARFISEHRLTVFSCVPSVATSMDRLGLLKEGALPSLRWVTFCGEALTVQQAEAMQRAAPNATVENMYGPTEATVGITSYLWNPEISPAECRRGIVPIGWPFPSQRTRIVDGELQLAGSQVFGGYWRDLEATAEAFDGDWYRTGDLVERDGRGCLHFVGRKDNQVQIRGHRVELGEVEAVLRDVFGAREVACVAWPIEEGCAQGIVAFVGHMEQPHELDLAAVRTRMPEYMMPSEMRYSPDLPRNANGKVDRSALVEWLEGTEAAHAP